MLIYSNRHRPTSHPGLNVAAASGRGAAPSPGGPFPGLPGAPGRAKGFCGSCGGRSSPRFFVGLAFATFSRPPPASGLRPVSWRQPRISPRLPRAAPLGRASGSLRREVVRGPCPPTAPPALSPPPLPARFRFSAPRDPRPERSDGG